MSPGRARGRHQRQGAPAGASASPAAEGEEINVLVAAAVDGDRRAIEALLAVIRPLVVRYCRPRVNSERAGTSADDVAQEVCLAVLKALPSYQDQGRPFLAFVYGIAAHKVVDAHRYVGRDRSDPTDDLPEEQDVHDGPEQAALALSDSADMRRLLEQLPAKQRDILVLRVVVGLSAEETAEAVDSTAGAVRVAQHRALSKLRQLVGATVAAPTAQAAPPPTSEPDWAAAPRTGDVLLDRLFDRADEHLATLVAHLRVGSPVTAPPERERFLAQEHDRMTRAAREVRKRM